MGYLLLSIAIGTEVVASLSLRASDGLSRVGFTLLAVAGYVVAFGLLSFTLQRGVPLGIAYGIWAGTGAALVAALSVPLFGESLSVVQAGGMLLVIAGVVAIEFGRAH